MNTCRIFLITLLALFLASLEIRAEDNKLPADVQAILDKADTIELLSLEPAKGMEVKDGFHGYKILGKTTVKGADARKVVAAIHKGIKDSDGTAAACFMPRHGIRAKVDDKTVDLVICYQCLSMTSYLGDKEGVALTTDAPGTLLNTILKDAKVPLPKN